MPPYLIRVLAPGDDREELYRFRYSVYVEELHYNQPFADHTLRRIADPLDQSADIIVAYDSYKQVVGTVRLNLAERNDLGHYEGLFGLSAGDSGSRGGLAICTRLMVAQNHRKTHLGIQICQAVFRIGKSKGILRCFADCYDPMLPFFLGLGFRLHRDNVTDPQYGKVNVIRLDLDDSAHLRDISSPLIDDERSDLTINARSQTSNTVISDRN